MRADVAVRNSADLARCLAGTDSAVDIPRGVGIEAHEHTVRQRGSADNPTMREPGAVREIAYP